MPKIEWYYALGDEEQGPVDRVQLKTLAASGKLGPDDLVWKDGMDDWKRAEEVTGLFSDASGSNVQPPPVDDPPPPPAPTVRAVETPVIQKRPSRRGARRSSEAHGQRQMAIEPLRHGRLIGQPLLLLGLVLVLSARGCDAIGNRYVSRLGSLLQLEENQFQDDWDEKRAEIQENTDLAIAGRQQDRQKLDSEMNEKKIELQKGRWRKLRLASRDAGANNNMWGFWREILFVVGTVALSVGLLAVAFTGQGAERWICLIMLAIITFSLYVGGVAWVGSIPGLVR